MLLGGVIGAFITFTVIQSMDSLGPAKKLGVYHLIHGLNLRSHFISPPDIGKGNLHLNPVIGQIRKLRNLHGILILGKQQVHFLIGIADAHFYRFFAIDADEVTTENVIQEFIDGKIIYTISATFHLKMLSTLSVLAPPSKLSA